MTKAAEIIDYARLDAAVETLHVRYADASPWPHVVIDDLLDRETALRGACAFPPFGTMRARLARLLEARSYESRVGAYDPVFAEIFEALHGPRFTAFVERVTGIMGLEADREHLGAGLHQGARGSALPIHADHNTHPNDASRYRRVNVLLYLNEFWQARWNGDLELWDRFGSACRVRIAPLFNRCAILAVDDSTYHGYGALRTPAGRSRKALAAYYYSDAPASRQTREPHTTTWPDLATQTVAARLVRKTRKAILERIDRTFTRR